MSVTEIVFSLITMLGGAALFLYGMKIMSSGLEKAAGDSMQKLIENLTSNIFKGVLVGAVVTALLQASGATTVMVVGFVNAGMMTLRQATGVIMGANIGTTITAQILSLAGIDGGVWYLEMLKPQMLANFLLIVGIVLVMFLSKGNKLKGYIGEILIGLGAVFIGMNIMTESVSSMQDLPVMKTIFTGINNPVLGILAGTAITALLQSSSASVGILQAFTVTGLVTWRNAIPMILGQNIGTCMVALMSGMGATKNAKRASMLHLLFNIIGVIICFVLVYGLNLFFHFGFWDQKLTMNSIANFHSGFNIINTILLLPCRDILVKLACLIVPDMDKKEDKKSGGTILDERFMRAPAIAVRQAMNEVVTMAETALDGYDKSMRVVLNDEIGLIDNVKEIENRIDKMESGISQYVTKIVAQHLNDSEKHTATTILHVVTDVERIGDHVLNICYCINDMHRNQGKMSKQAMDELTVIGNAVREALVLSVEGLKFADSDRALRIQPCEAVVDSLRDELKDRHIERLMANDCSVRGGIAFLDIINNLERISDHCSNIGISIEQLGDSEKSIDSHKYIKRLRTQNGELFDSLMEEYKNRFSLSAE